MTCNVLMRTLNPTHSLTHLYDIYLHGLPVDWRWRRSTRLPARLAARRSSASAPTGSHHRPAAAAAAAAADVRQRRRRTVRCADQWRADGAPRPAAVPCWTTGSSQCRGLPTTCCRCPRTWDCRRRRTCSPARRSCWPYAARSSCWSRRGSLPIRPPYKPPPQPRRLQFLRLDFDSTAVRRLITVECRTGVEWQSKSNRTFNVCSVRVNFFANWVINAWNNLPKPATLLVRRWLPSSPRRRARAAERRFRRKRFDADRGSWIQVNLQNST